MTTSRELFTTTSSQIRANPGQCIGCHETALDRRVPTRWNSDHDFICLQAQALTPRSDFMSQVSLTTGLPLPEYDLTSQQWKLADNDLTDALVALMYIHGHPILF